MNWSHKDFEKMGWHDCMIHGIVFKWENHELVLDIDYILEWINPENDETYYKFRISPATLIFFNVWNLNLNLEDSLKTQIVDLTRTAPSKPRGNATGADNTLEYNWVIETTNGVLSFKASGYNQFTRVEPILFDKQFLKSSERNNSLLGMIYNVQSE